MKFNTHWFWTRLTIVPCLFLIYGAFIHNLSLIFMSFVAGLFCFIMAIIQLLKLIAIQKIAMQRLLNDIKLDITNIKNKIDKYY